MKLLDPIDANYLEGSERIGICLPSHPLRLARRSTKGLLWRAVRQSLQLHAQARNSLLRLLRLRSLPLLAAALTLNQQRVVLPVIGAVRGSTLLVSPRRYADGRFPWIAQPDALARIISLIFIPAFLLRSIHERGYRRRAFPYAADKFLYSYGRFVVWSLMLSRTQPTLVVLANDHEGKTRTLLFAARRRAVPSLYVQHASVNDTFPVLESDYALLYGVHAAECYDRPGARGTVFLTGTLTRAGAASVREHDTPGRRIGVALNHFDPIDRIVAVLEQLRQVVDVHVSVRPHPRMGKSKLQEITKLASALGVSLSLAAEESTEAFVRRCYAVIAGESAILLDAALHGVEPVYFDFPAVWRDHYGYVRDGLVRYAFSEVTDLVKSLASLRPGESDVLDRAHYYSHDIGTRYEGRGSSLASEIVAQLSRRQDPARSGWYRLSGFRYLNVYEYDEEQDVYGLAHEA